MFINGMLSSFDLLYRLAGSVSSYVVMEFLDFLSVLTSQEGLFSVKLFMSSCVCYWYVCTCKKWILASQEGLCSMVSVMSSWVHYWYVCTCKKWIH